MRKVYALALYLIILVPANAQEPIDWEMVGRIKHEGFNNSQVMEIMFQLTDVHGPRLTNSPGQLAAAAWAEQQLREWGASNVKQEAWGEFGRGWSTEHVALEMTAPGYASLIAYPKAWTASTDGVVSGQPVIVEISGPDDLDRYRGTLQDKIVILRPSRELDLHLDPLAVRHDKESLQKLTMDQVARPINRSSRNPARVNRWRADRKKVFDFYLEEEVALLLDASSRDYGTITVSAGGAYSPGEPAGPPTLTVSFEQLSRIVRLLDKDVPVELSASVSNTFYDDDFLGYNIIAEIPGSDRRLKDEVVMLGAHFDSWHAGTGATDNAAGSVVTMEVIRILKALNIKPRRTIRLALWTGEEQGLLGSRGYVKKRFGDRETMQLKAAHKNLAAYFNLDNGSGKIRGVYLQGNDAVRPIFEAWLKPFNDLGASSLAFRNTGGTDHLSFDALGLPGFQFIQDGLEYGSKTHHTNMDVYDHVVEADLMQAAVIMASFVYHAAQRDKKLPRKPLPVAATN